ncbi:MAG: amidase [Thermoleophilia bacterium]
MAGRFTGAHRGGRKPRKMLLVNSPDIRLWERSATELAALIAAREVSSREVVAAHLARIDEVNGRINALTVVLRQEALAAADAADRGVSSSALRADLGPFHGVPITVKENLDCKGTPTTHGIPALRDSLPWRDAPVVERMKAAGAIVIGRTNLSEYGLRLDTANPLRGRTRNPWNPGVTPGGSSGGDAAALATGMTPFGLGNDLAGSVRNPAYCCGIAALKPTVGRIPRAGSIPPLDFGFALQAMAVEGPMARSVADLRVGLATLAGRHVRDPRSVDAPLEGPPPAVPRAALVLSIPGVELPAATQGAIQRAGQLLARAGWEVELAEPPELDLVNDTWLDLALIDFAEMLPGLSMVVSPPVYRHMIRLCALAEGREVDNSALHARRSSLMRLWSEFLVRYPVVVGPTWTQLPWPVDADLDPETGVALTLATTRFILPANVLGLPAVALPMAVADGQPTGVQFYADLWREDLCLLAAETVESGVERCVPIDPVWT